MLSTIYVTLWVVLSAVVMILMAKMTNIRATKATPDDEFEEIHKCVQPYEFNTKAIMFFILIIILSGIAACFASIDSVSTIAYIKLGICYLAVLGAAVIDIKLHIIPNFIPLGLIIARILIFIYELIFTDKAISYIISSLIGCFLCCLILLIADKVSKGGIGKGDIKLLASIGFMCGLYAAFFTLLLALLFCIIIAVVLLLAKRKKSKDHLPFGPFIYLGYISMILLTLY